MKTMIEKCFSHPFSHMITRVPESIDVLTNETSSISSSTFVDIVATLQSNASESVCNHYRI